jgi:hypothetical protein
VNVARFFVPGTLPGMNEITAAAKSGHGRTNAYARIKAKWQSDIVLIIRGARIGPTVTPIFIHFEWREKDRRRNPDNIAAGKKIPIDALVKAKVIKNDGWGEIGGWQDSFAVDAKRPGVLVTVFETRGEDAGA